MTTDETTGGRRAVWPGDIPSPLSPYSPAISAGGWLFVAGQLASDFETGLAPECRQANPNAAESLRLQADYVLRNLAALHESAGMSMRTDVGRMCEWFATDHPTMEELRAGTAWPRTSITPYLEERETFLDDPPPASTAACVRDDGLLVRGTVLEVDMISVAPRPGAERRAVPPPEGGGPAPGTGSPGVCIGDWVFLSGHVSAPAPAPGHWAGGEIETQTEDVLRRLAVSAQAAGTSLERCVKATVHLATPSDFAGMDRVWRRWFPDWTPARVVIPYLGLGARGARVQVAMDLVAGDAELPVAVVETSDAPEPLGHEPQAVRAGPFLFFSTQMAFDSAGALAAETRRHPEFPWYGQPAKRQMHYILGNVDAICRAAGTTLENVCRRQAFHDDFTWFAETMEGEWASHFAGDKPASTTLRIGGPLVVPGAHVLLDIVGHVPAP